RLAHLVLPALLDVFVETLEILEVGEESNPWLEEAERLVDTALRRTDPGSFDLRNLGDDGVGRPAQGFAVVALEDDEGVRHPGGVLLDPLELLHAGPALRQERLEPGRDLEAERERERHRDQHGGERQEAPGMPELEIRQA